MSPSIYRRVSRSCTLLAMVLGALTLVGWMTGLEALASIRKNYIPMAPSTALAFTVLGGVMVATRGKGARNVFARILVGCVALVASAKLFEFFTGISLGVDEALVADPAMFGAVQKGRMAPITATNFLLMSFAIFALGTARLRPWASPVATVALGMSFV